MNAERKSHVNKAVNKAAESMLEEEAISVKFNGAHLFTAMVTPGHVKEFVVGYLYAEELISSLADIESMRIEDCTASVLTKNPFKMLKRRMVLSGCGSSSSFLDEKKLKPISTQAHIRKNTVLHGLSTMSTICSDNPSGTTAAALLRDELYDELCDEACLFQCTDIGLHAACVTCIGYGLLHATDFSTTVLAISGRIATEIIRISLICGIPVIISPSLPTRLAVEVAEKMGLCLICSSKETDLAIYSHKEYIISA